MAREASEFYGFLKISEEIEDVRRSGSVLHSVSELLFVALTGLMCGANSWEDLETFAENKLEVLRQFLPFVHGHPSKDTLRRFFRGLDSAVFKDFFVRWMQSLAPAVADRVIAIDGTTSRHSGDGTGSPLHLVSAFACEARLVLGQQEVADKSNEITAIPVLLATLALEEAIVTIDAMGCQHKIADVITGKKGQYVLALKGNQSTLHDDVKLFLEDPETRKNAATCTDVDAGHGRIETRTCTVTDDIDWLKARHPAWQSLHSIVRLESIREIKGVSIKEVRYFVTSLPPDPQKILKSIRAHWAIENTLHWTLDVTFLDDANRTRKDHAPLNLAILRHITANLLQKLIPPKKSLAKFRKELGWNDKKLSQNIKNTLKISS